MESEKQLLTYTKNQCKKNGVLCYKFSSPSKRGVPDLLLIGRQGKVIFIELKSPTGKGRLSALQAREIRLLRAIGATVYVIDNKGDIDVIIAGIRPHDSPE